MTSPDLGTAAGTVRITYESTGAAKVVNELNQMKNQVQGAGGGFAQATSAFNNLGKTGANVTGALGGQISGLATTFLTLGKSGTSGIGAVTTALGMMGRGASSAMRDVAGAIKGGGSQIAGAASGVGNMAGAAMGAAMKLAMSAGIAAIVAAVAGIGIVLGAGLKRLVALDEAKTKLKALGYEGEEVKGIMEDVKEAALGTAYSLDEMATGASQALAAGVAPGADLTEYLKGVAGAAGLANKDFNEMAMIFNKIQATGKLTGRTLQQMEMAGLAPVAMLSKQLGKSQAEIREMVTKGQITADVWQKTVTGQMGNAADIMGKSITGSIRNMKAAIGRLGENILAPLFEGTEQKAAPIPALINKISKAIDSFGKSVGAWVAANKDDIKTIWNVMKSFASFVMQIYGTYLKTIFTALTTIWKAAWEVGKKIFAGLAEVMRKWSGEGKQAMEGFKDGAAKLQDYIRQFGPILAKIFATMAAMALDSLSMLTKGLSIFMEFLGHVGPAVIAFGEVCIKTFQGIAKGAGALGGILEKVPDPLLRMAGKSLKGIEKGWDAADQSLQGAKKSIDAIHGAAPAMGEMSKDLSGLSGSLKEINWQQVFAESSAKSLAEAQRRGGKKAEEAAKGQQALEDLLKELEITMEDLQKGIQGTDDDYDKLLKTLKKKGAPEGLVKFVREARAEFKKLGPEVKTVVDAIQAMGDRSLDSAGKADKLIAALEALGVIPADLERAHRNFHETLNKTIEYTDDWVDRLFTVGPALLEANGQLNAQAKNAQEAEKRILEQRDALLRYIAVEKDAGKQAEAWAEYEQHAREVLARVGITNEADIQRALQRYTPPKQTVDILTSVQDGDKTKAEFATILAGVQTAKDKGLNQFNLKFKVEGDPDELKAAVEEYGAVWKNYNTLTGVVEIEVPDNAEFLAKRNEIITKLQSPEPIAIPVTPETAGMPKGFKPWFTNEEYAKAKKDAEDKAKKDPVKLEVAPDFQQWQEAGEGFFGGGGSFDIPPVEVKSEVKSPTVDLSETERSVKEFGDKLPELLTPAVNKASDQGLAFANSFAAGILSGMGAVRNAAIAIAEQAAGALPGSPAKWGPLSGEGFTGTRGKKFTSAFAQGITSNVGSVRSAAVSVAYGAAKPMTDRFEQFISDLGELSSFGRKIAGFLNDAVNIGLQVGNLISSLGEQFGMIPKQYQAATKTMSREQAARLQRAQALQGAAVSPILGPAGKGVNITANAGNVEVSTTGTTVPLVQNPDGTWTSPDPEWAKLIKRESTGRANIIQQIQDINSGGNEAQGLFQITPQTWLGAGGQRFAPSPNMATPTQQAAIAAQIFGQSGGRPWGSGAGQQFGRENEALLRAGLVKPAQQAGQSLVALGNQSTSAASALKGASVTYSKSYLEGAGLAPLYQPGEYEYGSGRMPAWVEDMAKQFGVQVGSSISASGATSTHGAGFGFDFSGTAANMERIASYIQNNLAKDTLQLIHQAPGGQTYNVAGGQVLQGTQYYGPGTFGQHQDHVHWAAAVAPILANANATAMDMPSSINQLGTQFAGTGALPGPQARPGPIPAPGPRPGPIDDATQSIIDLGGAARDSTPKIGGLGNQAAGTAVVLGQTQVDLSKPGLALEENLQPATIGINRAISQIFGPQGITTIGGYRPNDPYPFHPGGRALDVMINNWQDSGQKELGDSINAWLIQNAAQLGLEATIWRQTYYGIENGFKASAMQDQGDATQNHMDHVHLQTKVGAVGLDTAGALNLSGIPVSGGMLDIGALPQFDSNNLASSSNSLLGIPDIIRSQAEGDATLAEAIGASRSGQAVDQAKAIQLTQHMDGLIAQQGDKGSEQAKYLGQIRDGIMARGGIEEAPGGGMLDQIGSIAGGVSTIINDFFDIFDTTLKAIADTKAIGDTLARGIANTEDIMRIIDGFQTFLELGQKIAQTVSDISGFAAQMVSAGAGADPTGGASAAASALQAVSAIAGIIAGVIGLINSGIELAQEAYKIGTKYMGRMLQAWLGLPGANDVAYLLDTLTGQLQAYTTENPELKQTFNTLGRQLGFQQGDRIGAQNQFNIYQGPGQDPRDTMSDAMFTVRSSGVGAFGYAGQ